MPRLRRSKRRGHPHPPQHAAPLTIDGQPVTRGETYYFNIVRDITEDPEVLAAVERAENGVYVVSQGSPHRYEPELFEVMGWVLLGVTVLIAVCVGGLYGAHWLFN